MEILMSVCVDAEYGYSRNKCMAWSVEEEWSHFLKLLTAYPVGHSSILIGRTSWETDGIPSDLINHFAKILVITKTKEINENNGQIISKTNVAEAITDLKDYLVSINNVNHHRLYILGGGEIYRQCFELNLIDQLVLSKLSKSYNCTEFLSWLPKDLHTKMQLSNTKFHNEFIVEYYQKLTKFTFTCESVTEGHPDKICDIISDSIVDAYLAQDKWSKVACEVMSYENMIFLCGYSLSNAVVNEEIIVRQVLEELGYDDESKGINYKTCHITINIHKRSSPNLKNLSEIPADDQAIIYGYATNETLNESMMPFPQYYAAQLTLRLTYLRKSVSSNNFVNLNENEIKLANMLRPVGKSQITAEYEIIDKFKRKIIINTIVLEAQHNPDIDINDLRKLLRTEVINKVIPNEFISPNVQLYINNDGIYTHGGFLGGGLTGRKQNIDSYGGICRNGGGAMSGKDYCKMDRSGAYAARWIAKSLVASKFCDRCTIGLAYAIGHSKPVMITVDTEYTSSLYGFSDQQLIHIIEKNFDLSAGGIIESLNLQSPIYKNTASGGHFGRDGFSWEVPKILNI